MQFGSYNTQYIVYDLKHANTTPITWKSSLQLVS